jgi:hypothetical protein
MKLERHRTVFFVFIAGLAFADLVGIFLTTFPVLLVYSHGYYFGGVRDSTNLSFLNDIIVLLSNPHCFILVYNSTRTAEVYQLTDSHEFLMP